MVKTLEEITGRDGAAEAEDAEAQQRFLALEFPARHGANVIKRLAATFGNLVDRGFPHLKRMKKHDTHPGHLVALVVPCDTDDDDDVDAAAVAASDPRFAALAAEFDGELVHVEVLKRGPRTREAWVEHTQRWPLIFHASVLPETTVEPITDDELAAMGEYLDKAEACAAASASSSSADGPQVGCCASGCVIVDPLAPVGAQVVADSQQARDDRQYAFRTIFHPVMIAIDSVAARDRARGEASTSPPIKKPRHSASSDDDKPMQLQQQEEGKKAQTTTQDTPTLPAESYLCTGYDMYMDVEPCAMCAMALIHSRARRVIFKEPNATDGALVSHFHLHTIKSLNHHYRAFRLYDQGNDEGER